MQKQKRVGTAGTAGTAGPIRSLRGYRAALRETAALGEAAEGSHDAQRIRTLARLVRRYEQQYLLFDDPDAVEFLRRVTKARGLRRKDLEPCIGSRNRVADVLARKTALTLGMVSRLSTELGLPAQPLLRRSTRP